MKRLLLLGLVLVGCGGMSRPVAPPEPGRPLSEALAEFNETLKAEKPWGYREVSENEVKESILREMDDLKGARSHYEMVLGGTMPKGAHFLYHSQEVAPRYFFVRLEVAFDSSRGFALAVGDDISESN